MEFITKERVVMRSSFTVLVAKLSYNHYHGNQTGSGGQLVILISLTAVQCSGYDLQDIVLGRSKAGLYRDGWLRKFGIFIDVLAG